MTWKAVCVAADVAVDTVKKYEVDGINILIANVGDGFRAYPTMCPHMEEPLHESAICSNGTMTCTKHLWQWDMKTGEVRGPAEKPLLMYQVKLEGEQVMVFLDQELEYDFDDDDDDDDF
ncbi:MAG: Rieske 2Fe-2S domain-containing protein [Gammaproteobacteria bacterium]|nr:Rieske 2Fe-2S domain-containing protein [Gammaproteobacteria bacterium]